MACAQFQHAFSGTTLPNRYFFNARSHFRAPPWSPTATRSRDMLSQSGNIDMVCYYAKGTITTYRVGHIQGLMIGAPTSRSLYVALASYSCRLHRIRLALRLRLG